MGKNKIIFIALVCAGLSSACVEWWDRDSSKCKVSTQVSHRYLTFPNTGGEELVDVNPKPYHIIQKVQIGKVGDEGYMYEERSVESYGTSNYTVQKVGDGRLVVRTNPYYGDTALKFEVVVKGGDCSEIIYCTIKP